jgi:hypothetical protein
MKIATITKTNNGEIEVKFSKEFKHDVDFHLVIKDVLKTQKILQEQLLEILKTRIEQR